jgi:hypothetical protein
MQDTISTVTLLGIGIAMSPVPILATILLLSTREAGRNGLAYAVGFLVGLTALTVLVFWVVRQQEVSLSSAKSHVVAVGTLALGLALVAFSSYQLTHRRQNLETPPVPGWLRIVDRFRTPQSAGLGFFNSAFNAKNFALLLVAASIVGENRLNPLETSIALVLLLVLAMLGIIAPLCIYLIGGQRSTSLLDAGKRWLILHNATVMAVLFLFFGVILAIKGVLKLNTPV